ncbi:MAG: F0F1 ATP synthase subunit A [Chloroflexota bacterium]|jgi:F-type H+-transporting ATPase subunit a
MDISPDTIIYYEWGPLKLNATILFTWLVMTILVGGSWLITRNLTPDPDMARGQNLLEVIVETVRNQIREIGQQEAERYLPFVGTLFIFIAFANLLAIIPGYQPPTGSLSTTAALAICVFVAVPLYGVSRLGFVEYLKQYLRPNPIMLPFNIIGELSRTLALAVRLFGNVMSGTMIAAVLISIVPLFFPIIMQLLGLITGFIQAYIFAVLAMVYIASATRVQGQESE